MSEYEPLQDPPHDLTIVTINGLGNTLRSAGLTDTQIAAQFWIVASKLAGVAYSKMPLKEIRTTVGDGSPIMLTISRGPLN